MRAVALTDHGNMFGAIQLYKACKEQGVQAILGCEVNVAPRRPRQGRARRRATVDHLVLLAATEEGYKNLVRIVSRGTSSRRAQRGAERARSTRSPSTARRPHRAHRAAWAAWSRSASSSKGEAAGRAELERLRACVRAGLPLRRAPGSRARRAARPQRHPRRARRRDLDLPLVATNDVHYGEREDAEAQLYLSCIAARPHLRRGAEAHHGCFEMYLKTPDEMAQLLPRPLPRRCRATLAIAESCAAAEAQARQADAPGLQGARGLRHADVLPPRRARGARRGASRSWAARARRSRRGRLPRAPRDRDRRHRQDGVPGLLPHRLGLHPLRQGERRPVGPGRGSGAGSLVAYSMRITDLDPIPYDLLFERFLNPERVCMPDFDVDFCMDRRDEVIDYVAQNVRRDSRSARSRRSTSSRRGASSRTWPRDGHAGQRGAADRQPHPAARCRGRCTPSPRRSRSSPSSRRCRTSEPTVARAHQAGAEARGAHAPRRQARRRRRHQRRARSGITFPAS